MFSHNVGGMTQLHDLYQFVSGPWLKTHVIPDDRGVDGTFHKLRDEAEELSHKIVEEDTGRAGTLYNSYMDTDGINAAGMAPLDRKSTRLNSSHVAISYAVFCLKKKRKQ